RAEPPTKPPPLPRTATPATPLPLTTTAPSNAVFEPAEPTTPGAAPPRLVDKPSGGHLRDQRTTVLGLPIVPGGVPVLPAPASSRSRPNRIEGEETTSGGAFSSPTTGSFTSAEPILDEPAFIEQPPPTDDWPAEPSRPSGNWSIALDPTRPDGWGDPAKMETPPEVEHAASDVIGGESDSAEMQALPMRLSEPKVQIDPTFIDSLPKLADDAFAPTLTEPTGLTATVPMTPISSRGMPAADDPALGDTLPRAARSRPLPGLPPPPVSATAATAPAFAPLPADYPMVAGDPPTVLVTPSKRKRTPMIVAGVAVLAAAGVATVLLTRGGDRAKPTVARTTQMPTHDPTPATRSPAAADHEAPEDPSERTTAPQATCKVQVVSVPKGAAISLDDKTLGTAPTTLSLPCGSPVKLVARRVRYAATTRAITPRPDATKPLVIKLQRATFAIKVSSTPQGAKIMLGRKLMGVTPTSIKLPGFSPVTLRIIKDGYGARTEKLIPKHNNQAVHVALKKAKRR
ncbi:MAG: PEGA domain-containing protein, partial [Kofleriaceae bacterium]